MSRTQHRSRGVRAADRRDVVPDVVPDAVPDVAPGAVSDVVPGVVPDGGVTVGVDTHQRTHHAAVLDGQGRLLGDRQFSATEAGYAQLWGWVSGFGSVDRVGVESTGTYGAGLAGYLMVAGVEVIEVSRPDKTTRARQGKSDPIDAASAARQVQSGQATGLVKIKSGVIESLRVLKVTRDSAVGHRCAALSQLRDVITTTGGVLREEMLAMTPKQRVAKALTFRPDITRAEDPAQSAKLAMRSLARRIRVLDEEIHDVDAVLTGLVIAHLPTLVAKPQIGPQIAAQLAITAGENIDRLGSEAAFAKLTGTAPVPASSGKTRRMRLDRGGNRQANSALYMIVIGRMKNHPETRAYHDRRTAEGLSKRDIIRCLKRYAAREAYHALKTDLTPH